MYSAMLHSFLSLGCFEFVLLQKHSSNQGFGIQSTTRGDYLMSFKQRAAHFILGIFFVKWAIKVNQAEIAKIFSDSFKTNHNE